MNILRWRKRLILENGAKNLEERNCEKCDPFVNTCKSERRRGYTIAKSFGGHIDFYEYATKPRKLLELIQKTTISSSIKQRTSKGSSGTSEQTRMIGQRNRKIVTLKNSIKIQNDNVKKSLTLLEKRVKTLTK